MNNHSMTFNNTASPWVSGLVLVSGLAIAGMSLYMLTASLDDFSKQSDSMRRFDMQESANISN